MEFKEFKEFKGVKDNSLFASFKGVFIAKTYVFNSFYSLNSLNSPSFQKLSIFYFRCKITQNPAICNAFGDKNRLNRCFFLIFA